MPLSWKRWRRRSVLSQHRSQIASPQTYKTTNFQERVPLKKSPNLVLTVGSTILPQATMFGEELYPHLFTKAAALLRSIAQNQAFIDGNKRIAWIATRVFLAANGIDVHVSLEEGLQLMNDLAEKKSTLMRSEHI